MIEVSELTDLQQIEALAGEWQDLLEASGNVNAYLTPQYMLPWYRLASQTMRCRMLLARHNQKLVGLAPLAQRRQSKFGIGFSLLGFPMRGTTPPFDLVIAQDQPEVFPAFMDHLAKAGDWDLLSLNNIPEESPNLPLFETHSRRCGLSMTTSPGMQTLYVPVTGTWDEFFAGRPKKMRNNTRRNWRNGEELGKLELQCFPDDETLSLDCALKMAFEVIGCSWKQLGGQDDQLFGFFEDLAKELNPKGMLKLRFLLLDGQPIAYLFEIVYNNILFPFHSAYDRTYQRISPGQLALADELKWGHEQQFEKIDFMGGSEYLSYWTEEIRKFTHVEIVNSGWLAKAKVALYKKIHELRQKRAKQKTEEKREVTKRKNKAEDTADDAS